MPNIPYYRVLSDNPPDPAAPGPGDPAMAQHVWDTKTFTAGTVAQAEQLLAVCRKAEVLYETAVIFLGYATERVHQGSWRLGYGRLAKTVEGELARQLAGCIRTGHRYAN